jgi:electron transfer flavoprotein beta subunit
MKIIVVFKWGRDPQDARVGPDGSVDWRSAPMAVTDDDPAVLEVARAIASGADEIVGVTLGGGDVSWAAARGASSTVVVTDADSAPDSAATAAILAAGVRYIGEADLVLVGDSAWDRAVPVCLAGQLGWPALAEVKSAKVEDGRLRVTRRFGGGTQVVDVAKPAVLAVAGSRAEQDPPGMKEVLAARRKPLSRVTLGELGVEPDALVRSRGTALPDTAPARVIEGADPASAAAQLVAALRADGVIAG